MHILLEFLLHPVHHLSSSVPLSGYIGIVYEDVSLLVHKPINCRNYTHMLSTLYPKCQTQ